MEASIWYFWFYVPLAFLMGSIPISLFWGLGLLGMTTMWPAASVKINDGSITAIGKSLLTTYSLVFELISLVLLMAIIGALVLARPGRDKS